ncbi:MAG: hypothetical protein ACTJGV_15805 [Proteus vulgaris]|nr:hypothetical protein [Proteus mirabilis]
MAKRNNALENMKKWMEVIPQCLQPQNKQVESEKLEERAVVEKKRQIK